MSELPTNIEDVLRDLEALATFTEPRTPGWTRRAFTPAFVAGRAWLTSQMHTAGLATHTDAAGNLIGRLTGRADLPPLMLGSHSDTVLGGGRYDGALGVLAGIALARALAENNVTLRHPLEVVDFLAEEPTPFGACIGSAAIAGALDAAQLERRADDGRTLAEALRGVGGDPGALMGVARRQGDIAAYLELHIEQGRVLEAASAPIGVVSGIVGIRRAALGFTGRPDHAGTTPMALRHDALAAAAATVLAVEQAARGAGDAVATVGYLRVAPNQANVIPGVVEMQIEARSLAWATVERVWQVIAQAAQQAGDARGVAVQFGEYEHVAPVQTAGWLRAIIAESCAATFPGTPTLPSGAGHDGSYIGRIAPAGMIFVRSRDGRSHAPEEYSSPEDIAAGVAALGRALLAVDAAMG